MAETTFRGHLATKRHVSVDRCPTKARPARERAVSGARCQSGARLARKKHVSGAKCPLKARLARERPVCGARWQVSPHLARERAVSGARCSPFWTGDKLISTVAGVASVQEDILGWQREPPPRARAGRREISSLLGRYPKPRRCSLLSAHAALTASAIACRLQSHSSTSGRKIISSAQNEKRQRFLPFVRHFSRKTADLAARNEKDGLGAGYLQRGGELCRGLASPR